jgi:hypothetical protein
MGVGRKKRERERQQQKTEKEKGREREMGEIDINKLGESWVWWWAPVSSALGRLRQEDHEFKAGLGDIVISYLKKEKKERKKDIGGEMLRD